MSDSFLLIRSLIIYTVCVAVAVILGGLLATWQDTPSFYMALLALAMMVVPLLLRWHHFWLIATWNTSMVAFVLPGKPNVGLILAFASLFISVLQHILNRKLEYPSVRSLTNPLIFIVAVILVTAKLTGGMGMNILGSANIGGKRYVFMLGGIVVYFALAAQRIPPAKAKLCVAAFFLGGVTWVISDMAHFFPPSALYYLLLIFPPTSWWEGGGDADQVAGVTEIGRLSGVATAGAAVVFCMLAIYGVGGLFKLRKFWRLPLFGGAIVACLFGGFRSNFVLFALTFAGLFYFEGLLKSRNLPMIICGSLLVCVCALPFTNRMPLAIQRSLSVVPFISLDSVARDQAEGSTEWRLRVWEEVLPEVPRYLLVGRGLVMDANDLQNASTIRSFGNDPAGTILASDFHSGPLSIVIPFGLWGVLGFLWLIYAGLKVLYRNYKYGDPALQQLNNFLLAAFLARTIFFLVIFGSIFSDLGYFTAILGLSVAINGGMSQPVPVPVTAPPEPLRFAPGRAFGMRRGSMS